MCHARSWPQKGENYLTFLRGSQKCYKCASVTNVKGERLACPAEQKTRIEALRNCVRVCKPLIANVKVLQSVIFAGE